jgi:hypothetical protein
MKISHRRFKQIILEELTRALKEADVIDFEKYRKKPSGKPSDLDPDKSADVIPFGEKEAKKGSEWKAEPGNEDEDYAVVSLDHKSDTGFKKIARLIKKPGQDNWRKILVTLRNIKGTDEELGAGMTYDAATDLVAANLPEWSKLNRRWPIHWTDFDDDIEESILHGEFKAYGVGEKAENLWKNIKRWIKKLQNRTEGPADYSTKNFTTEDLEDFRQIYAEILNKVFLKSREHIREQRRRNK